MKYLAQLIRRIVYVSIELFDRIFSNEVPIVVVLCYHGIGKSEWQYDVSIENFIKQIELLLKTRKPIKLADLYEYLSGRKNIAQPSFVLTFDDGYKSVMIAREYLNKKKITPCLFLISNLENVNRGELGTGSQFLSLSEIKKIVRDGWEIGSHSATHSDFNGLTSSDALFEVGESKKKIERDTSTKVKYFAFPRGRYTDSILKKVKGAGYKLGLTMDDSLISRHTNLLKVPRIGIDSSHQLVEFKGTFTPSVIKLRKFLKKYNLNNIYG